MNYSGLSIAEIGARFRDRSLSPLDLTRWCFERIDRLDSQVQAWVHLRREQALAEAAAAGDLLNAGTDLGPLQGIPIGIKDIVDVEGSPTRANSPLLENNIAASDADVVTALRAGGAIILGKTVTTQFACFDPAETRNPFDFSRTPGGSSSGSAAALAAGMCFAAIGSQTGGSIIRPASFCGIAGLKPTFGRISRNGVIPVADSLDHIGPMTRTAGDLAVVWQVLSGEEPSPDPAVAGLTVGIPDRYFLDRCTDEMRNAFLQCSEVWRGQGAEQLTMELPSNFEAGAAAGPVLMRVECAHFHKQRFLGKEVAYQPKIRQLIGSGLAASAVEYLEARKLQQEASKEFINCLKGIHLMATPAALGAAPPRDTTGDPVLNSPFSTFGLPSLTVPMTISGEGLPLGLQVVAAPGRERLLLDFAREFERQRPRPIPQGRLW